MKRWQGTLECNHDPIPVISMFVLSAFDRPRAGCCNPKAPSFSPDGFDLSIAPAACRAYRWAAWACGTRIGSGAFHETPIVVTCRQKPHPSVAGRAYRSAFQRRESSFLRCLRFLGLDAAGDSIKDGQLRLLNRGNGIVDGDSCLPR